MMVTASERQSGSIPTTLTFQVHHAFIRSHSSSVIVHYQSVDCCMAASLFIKHIPVLSVERYSKPSSKVTLHGDREKAHLEGVQDIYIGNILIKMVCI